MNPMARFPLIPLPYLYRDEAVENEILFDYNTSEIYITKPDSSGTTGDARFIRITDAIVNRIAAMPNIPADNMTITDNSTTPPTIYTVGAEILDILGKLIAVNNKTDANTSSISVLGQKVTDLQNNTAGSDWKPGVDKLSTLEAYNNPTDGLCVNVIETGYTYKYGGNWTNIISMNSIRYMHAQCGISDNALVTGGNNDTNKLNTTELFNGTIWTNSTSMNSIRYYHGQCGISNSALITGGNNGSIMDLNTTEIFNGSVWTNSVNMNGTRYQHAQCGISNNALVTGGGNSSSYLDTTELFNGSVWTNSTTMNSIRHEHAQCGVSNNALVTGGHNGNITLNTTELFNGTTWTTSNTMNSIRHRHAMCGISNNSLVTGGSDGTHLNTIELFNGNTWTNSVNMNSIRSQHAMCGESNNALITGGRNEDGTRLNTTELYVRSWVPISANVIKNSSNTNAGLMTPAQFTQLVDNTASVATLTSEVASKPNITLPETVSSPNITYIDTDKTLKLTGLTVDDINIGVVGTTDKLNNAKTYVQGLITTDMKAIFEDKYTKTEIDNKFTSLESSLDWKESVDTFADLLAKYSTPDFGWTVNVNDEAKTYRFNNYFKLLDASLNSARIDAAGCGIRDSSLITGGSNGSDTFYNTTELFNGTTWTNSVNMNSIRYVHAICGVSNNALVTGGTNNGSSEYLNTTELFNGTEWSNSINMNSKRCWHAMCGVSNNALVTGGDDVNDNTNTTELFNGTVWTNSVNMNIVRSNHCICGISDNALVTGGNNGNNTFYNTTELFNGTVWTNSINMNISRTNHAQCGISNNALISGGMNKSDIYLFYNNTEVFNGSTWTNSVNMNNARATHIQSGTSSSALVAGGMDSSMTGIATTEYTDGKGNWVVISSSSIPKATSTTDGLMGHEYVQKINELSKGSELIDEITDQVNAIDSKPGVNTYNDLITYVSPENGFIVNNREDNITYKYIGWTNNVNMNVKRSYHAMCGIPNNALVAGGYNSGLWLNTTELFNGTIWNNSVNMNSKRHQLAMCGVSNNALVTGGNNGSTYYNTTELFNGSVWTNSVNMNSIRYDHGICGIANNALVTGGCNTMMNDTYLNTTELFNGTTWSNSANMNSIRCDHAQCGVSYNALVTGGYNDNFLNTTEIFNGRAWTNSVNMNSIRHYHAMCGVSNNALVTGGGPTGGTYVNTTELFTGTIWNAIANMNTIRSAHAQCGISNNALITGGTNGIYYDTTELYRGWQPISINALKVDSDTENGLISPTAMKDIIAVTKNNGGSVNNLTDMQNITNPTEGYTVNVNETSTMYKYCKLWVNSINMNNVRQRHSQCGTSNDSLAVAGMNDKTYYTSTELWNGGVWTAGSSILISRVDHAMCGVSNNALVTGGNDGSGTLLGTTELWNGTAWTNSINMNTNRSHHAQCGISNNALVAGGNNDEGTDYNTTEIFNGTAWTNSVNMNSKRYWHSMCGVSDNALVAGGGYSGSGSGTLNTTEIFNGTVWTISSNLITELFRHSMCGVSDNALISGGTWNNNGNYPSLFKSEIFNGTVWSASIDINTARKSSTMCGTSSNAQITGGYDIRAYSSTEILSYNWYPMTSNSIKNSSSVSNGLMTTDQFITLIQTTEMANLAYDTAIEISDRIDNIPSNTLVNNIAFTANSWVFDTTLGVYKYSYSNTSIKTTSSVDVRFPMSMIGYASFFGVMPTVDTVVGYAYIYSTSKPTIDLTGITIIISG